MEETKKVEEAKEVTVAVPEGKSALEARDEIARKIALEGPKDPDNFKMPDGRTLTETREAKYLADREEGDAETKANAEHKREQSNANDPLYTNKHVIVIGEDSQPRMVDVSPKESPKETPKEEAPAKAKETTMPPSTLPPAAGGEQQEKAGQ